MISLQEVVGKRFKSDEEFDFNNLVLPSDEEVYSEIINKIQNLYDDFIKKGIFYDYETVREFGEEHVRIFESDGYGTPYETIQDWANELTGCLDHSSFTPERYEGRIIGDADDFLYDYINKLNPDKEDMEECPFTIISSEYVSDILEQPIHFIDKSFH